METFVTKNNADTKWITPHQTASVRGPMVGDQRRGEAERHKEAAMVLKCFLHYSLQLYSKWNLQGSDEDIRNSCSPCYCQGGKSLPGASVCPRFPASLLRCQDSQSPTMWEMQFFLRQKKPHLHILWVIRRLQQRLFSFGTFSYTVKTECRNTLIVIDGKVGLQINVSRYHSGSPKLSFP